MKLSLASLILAMMATSVRAITQATCRVNPDPHFLTFHSIHYDYHGGCDLVLIQNPTFDGSDVFDLHIRTVPIPPTLSWAGISNAALQIGTDVLEVMDDGTYFINSIVGPLVPGVVANMGTFGYPVTYATSTTSDVWEVQLNAPQYVRITNFKWSSPPDGSISIEVFAESPHFSNSVGMCGTWGTPGLIGRDGVTDYQGTPNEGNDMALDWEVLPPPTEPQLFQVPPTENCTEGPVGGVPGGVPNNDNQIPPEDVKKLCQENVDEKEFNNCFFDVSTTNTREWINAPHYFKYKCISENLICESKGGKCVLKKDCDDTTHLCNPKLCYARVIPEWLKNLESANPEARGRRLTNEDNLLKGNEGGNNNMRHQDHPLLSSRYRVVDGRNMAVQDIAEKKPDAQKNNILARAQNGLSELRDPCVCAIPRKYKSGKCCKYTGPIPYNCAAIELLGPGADYDGRCNQVNGGHSCKWDYTDPYCCEVAMNDGNCNLPCGEAEEQCKCALEKEAA